ncbi:MAG TPA: hypothetical protein VHB23_08690 [Devosiaceae bacterium]|jgi:hypothetical protein|nr:hypothetical protein [Devosiaceae bacterium]
MGYARMQLRAAATAFVLFAISSFLLFLLVRGVGNITAVLPLPVRLPAYSPGDTIGALLDLRPVIALAAATLLVLAVLMIVRNAFLDRAVHMFASMLTLLLASSVGVIAGFGAYLSVTQRHLVLPQGALPVVICLAALTAGSLIALAGLQRSLLLRTLLAPVLALGAPILLMWGG